MMTGISDEERGDRNLMKDLALFTKLEPQSRMDIIETLKVKMATKFANDGYALKPLDKFKGILLKAP